MGSSQEDLESRFANLLQPIRDLTKNWDVDIASSLEDYLEEVCQHILQIYPAFFLIRCLNCNIIYLILF